MQPEIKIDLIYHENEKPKYKAIYKDGKRQGAAMLYYDKNGNPKYRAIYANSERQGIEKWY